jgi:pimeloyl-ACP methyl ester carboxylesterase
MIFRKMNHALNLMEVMMNVVRANSKGLESSPTQAVSRARLGCGWRIVMWLLASVSVLLGVGAIYQMVGTARDLRTYAPPGQMVDVGGYKMHLYCTGEGSPTVILDHVGAANSAQWALVQPVVAAQTRVCAYDRAGFGWSETGPDPQDAAHNAQQVHTLLVQAGIEGPFIYVGHSFGGNVARVFAANCPDDTAGLVLLDPGKSFHRPGVPEDIDARWRDEENGFMMIAPTMARIGLMQLARDLGAMPGHGDLPSPQAEAFDALQITPRFYDTLKAQQLAMYDTSAQVLAAEEKLGDLPVIVLSPTQLGQDGQDRQVWTEVNVTIAARSANGVHRTVAGADHMALAVKQAYASITADAILEVVAAVRGERPLALNQ